jgi:hypothetical protein
VGTLNARGLLPSCYLSDVIEEFLAGSVDGQKLWMKTYFGWTKAYFTDTDQSDCNIISRDKCRDRRGRSDQFGFADAERRIFLWQRSPSGQDNC